jgi:hypothetical protein
MYITKQDALLKVTCFSMERCHCFPNWKQDNTHYKKASDCAKMLLESVARYGKMKPT